MYGEVGGLRDCETPDTESDAVSGAREACDYSATPASMPRNCRRGNGIMLPLLSKILVERVVVCHSVQVRAHFNIIGPATYPSA